jgi:hypothetical protein
MTINDRPHPVKTPMTAAQRFLATSALLLLAAAARPADVAAQLPSAGTAALGMGENQTAAARGYNAVHWNPAALGLAGNPRSSLTFFPVRAIAGIGPVTLRDLHEWQGREVPREQREQWLQQIEAQGSQEGEGGVDLTVLAAAFGRIGFHAGTILRTTVDLPPAAAELAFFGNAGRTGEPRDIQFEGAALDAVIASTVGVTYAHPVLVDEAAGRRLAVGVTGKYTWGHILISGEDRGGFASVDPLQLEVRFPVVTSFDTVPAFNAGTGIGIDLGAAWQQPGWSAGLMIRNLVNTFAWDPASLYYRPIEAAFDAADESGTEMDARPFAQAPADVRARIDRLGFGPALAAGAAYTLRPNLLLAADFRTRLTADGYELGPRTHAGVGAEYRPLGFLPLRAGLAVVTGGTQLAGGLGLRLGSINLDGSIARRTGGAGDQVTVMFSFSSWGW